MSLLNIYGSDTVGKQLKFKDELVQQITQMFNYRVAWAKSHMAEIYNNQDGLTPQQCFDALGTDAAQAVDLKNSECAYLNAIVPNSIDPKPPNGLVENKNPDGTVTVTG